MTTEPGDVPATTRESAGHDAQAQPADGNQAQVLRLFETVARVLDDRPADELRRLADRFGAHLGREA